MSAIFRIEPFVYKTVLLRGPKHAAQFLGALTSHRPPEFAQLHVKALCIRSSIPLGLTIQLLTMCSGLESLALWIPPQSGTADLINLLSSLPLTFLTIVLASIQPASYWKPILQDHPIFVNLTHLDIVDHWMLWTSTHGIEHLPHLTHVAFRFWSCGVNATLSTILRQSPKLRVLVLLADSKVIPGTREYIEKQCIRDIRVVVLQHVRDSDEWESMKRDSVTMWQRADMIIRWRRCNRGWYIVYGRVGAKRLVTAGPFDFPSGFSFGPAEATSEYTP
jgi:hypothetical protein